MSSAAPLPSPAVETPVHELVRRSAEFEGLSPLEILRVAADAFPGRLTLATSLGVEDCVLIDLVGTHRLPIDLFSLDTGLLFPETHALWRSLEERYGITIRAVTPALTLGEQATRFGPNLWERDAGQCCALRKLEPLKRTLAGFDAWVTAIRRDQTPDRASSAIFEDDRKFGLVKVNPLVAWTSRDVWRHILDHKVPYNPLHDRDYPSIGCAPCTSPVRPGEDPRSGRWRGTVKTECGLHSRDSESTSTGPADGPKGE